MWLEQDATLLSHIQLQEKLTLFLKKIAEHELYNSNTCYSSFIDNFKSMADGLLLNLTTNDTFDTDSFKKLIRLCRQCASQFSGHFRHRSFAKLCKDLYTILNEASL